MEKYSLLHCFIIRSWSAAVSRHLTPVKFPNVHVFHLFTYCKLTLSSPKINDFKECCRTQVWNETPFNTAFVAFLCLFPDIVD